MDYRNHLVEYIRSDILGNQAAAPPDEQSLIDSGVLDSLGIINLLAFIESRFGIRVPERDIVPENFDSIRSMVTYLSGRSFMG